MAFKNTQKYENKINKQSSKEDLFILPQWNISISNKQMKYQYIAFKDIQNLKIDNHWEFCMSGFANLTMLMVLTSK